MVIKLCVLCGKACRRESVDIGVGIIHGPYGCAANDLFLMGLLEPGNYVINIDW